MDTPTHTPGPWTLEDVTARQGRKRIHVYFRVCGANAEPVAGLDGDKLSIYQNEEANARLVAAAPELLEALEQVLGALSGRWPKDIPLFVGEAARAALAKARGTP